MTKQRSFRFDEKLLSAVDAARSICGETRTDFFRRAARQQLRRLLRAEIRKGGTAKQGVNKEAKKGACVLRERTPL